MERRREMHLIVAPSFRFGGAPAERGENPPDLGPWDQNVVVTGIRYPYPQYVSYDDMISCKIPYPY